MGFPGGSVVKNLSANAGDMGSISGLGRAPGEGNGNPLQYSFLENPTDRDAWWDTVHGILQARTLSGQPFPPPGDLPNPDTTTNHLSKSPKVEQSDIMLLPE